VTATGVCTNLRCARAARPEPVELYPGPGQYCPNCGERLRPSHSALPPRTFHLRRRSIYIASAAIVGLVTVTAAFVVVAPPIGAFRIRVCSTTMTDRIVNEIVHDYTAHHFTWPRYFEVTRAGDAVCHVRFRTAFGTLRDSAIARDGVVAVVNPQNRIARLDISQLRDVLGGRIVDWSQLGGKRAAIAVVAPEDGSDESRVLAARVTLGQPLGPHVDRRTAAEIVRLVSSPSGLHSIGIVPFSAAVPAKVIGLGRAPPPSPLSISGDRYPLSVSIIAESDFRYPAPPIAAMLAFAHSENTKNLVARTALISKDGP
jgi:hypothetical protein